MATRILAIDNDEATLQFYHDLLTDIGYEVAVHLTPEGALAELDRFQPDLIILDWLFGQESPSLDLLQRLRQHPSTATTPVVVCSAATKALDVVAAELQGQQVAVVYNPFTIDELLAAITTALGNAGAGRHADDAGS